MLRRLKQSVVSELPTKTERVLHCGLSAYQAALTAIVTKRLTTLGPDTEGAGPAGSTLPVPMLPDAAGAPGEVGTGGGGDAHADGGKSGPGGGGGGGGSGGGSGGARGGGGGGGSGPPKGQAAALKSVNNTLMELRNVCNHPFLSALHVPHSELSLPTAELPPVVTLCGKLDLLDRLLLKLHKGGHKVRGYGVGQG